MIAPHLDVEIPLIFMGETSVGKTTMVNNVLSMLLDRVVEFGK